MFKSKLKDRISQLENEIKSLENKLHWQSKRLTSLCEIFGFASHPEGGSVFNPSNAKQSRKICSTGQIFLCSGALVSPADTSKNPVTRKELELLMKYLEVEFQPEQKVPEKVISAKIVPIKAKKKKSNKK